MIRYPYAYCALGPLISAPLLFATAILAYISASYMLEALSVANTIQANRRRNSLFSEECYRTPQTHRRTNDLDSHMKESEFYIRQKLEIGIMFDRLSHPFFKYAFMTVLIVYMYGAMSLKYVSGAESLYQGISFLFWDNEYYLEEQWDGWYYVSIAIFAALSIGFSFGDIENSKTLQQVTSILRVFVLGLMCIGCVIYLG